MVRRITVSKDGPYFVEGGVPLVRATIVTNDAGESIAWHESEHLETEEVYALCRCGHSASKPYCDFTHLSVGFDGTETAGHPSYVEMSVSIGTNGGLVLHDARQLCSEARFCDRAGGLWNLVEHCDDPAKRALAVEEAQLCPSGRYVAEDESGGPLEPAYEPSIALVEDPALGVSGPLWVRGGIEIVDSSGVPYEVRNRVTLCRCGQSTNKPFCDGSHIAAKFTDEG